MGVFMQNWQSGELTPAKAKAALGGDVDGMLAEQVVLPEQGVIKVPDHLSFECRLDGPGGATGADPCRRWIQPTVAEHLGTPFAYA